MLDRLFHRGGVLLIPLLSLLGLIAGFGREIALATFYGTSVQLEVLRIAFGLPAVLADGVAVSVVSVLVPFILAGRSGVSVTRVGSAGVTMASMAAVLGVLGALTMPLQADFFAPGFEAHTRHQMIVAGRVCWAGFVLVTLSLPIRGMLAARGAVWPGAGLQLMRSGGFVAALLVGLSLAGAGIEALLMAVVGSSVVVLAIHLLALGHRGRRMMAYGIKRGLRVDRGLAMALTTVLLSQVLLAGGRLLDRAVASDMEQGTVAAIEYSYGLLMAMAGLIGTTASLFVAPYVTRALRAGAGIPKRAWMAVGWLICATLLAGMCAATLALPLVRLVFGYGAFGDDAARLTAGLFRIHALGLAPVVAALILMQFVLVLKGPRMVFWIAGGKLVLKASALATFLTFGFAETSLTLSLVVAETGMALALIAYLIRLKATFSG